MEDCISLVSSKSLKDSDEYSLDDWVKETQMPLIRFCRQFVGDWAEAEDMAQEKYIRAWQKRSSFKGSASLLTWHMAIARRVCLDHLRRIRRAKQMPTDEKAALPMRRTLKRKSMYTMRLQG